MYSKIRKPIVIFTAVLFHLLLVFHLLFSPVIVVMASWKGIVNASFFAFAGMFLLALFFGRAYCAWFCPGCGVQELINLFVRKKAKNNRVLYLKYIVFALWMGSIAAGYLSGGFREVDLSYGMADVSLQQKILLTAGAVAVIVPLGAVFGQFASCKYLCWQVPLIIAGTAIRNYLALPGLRLQSMPENCSNCMACDKSCPMALHVHDRVKKGNMNHPECIMCGNCADACKREAIRFTLTGACRNGSQ